MGVVFFRDLVDQVRNPVWEWERVAASPTTPAHRVVKAVQLLISGPRHAASPRVSSGGAGKQELFIHYSPSFPRSLAPVSASTQSSCLFRHETQPRCPQPKFSLSRGSEEALPAPNPGGLLSQRDAFSAWSSSQEAARISLWFLSKARVLICSSISDARLPQRRFLAGKAMRKGHVPHLQTKLYPTSSPKET